MKHFYTLFFLLGLLPFSSSAQNFAKTTIQVSSMMGKEVTDPRSAQWEKEVDLISGPISKSKLYRMKSVADALVGFLHDSCLSAVDYSPTWHGEYFSKKNSPGPQLVFGVTCRFSDQKATLRIVANDIRPLLDHLPVGGQDFLTVRVDTAGKGTGLFFEYDSADGDDGTQGMKNKSWLVTTGDDQLPYIPVTRKEYLTEAKMELTDIKNSILSDLQQKMPVRPDAVQAAEKQAAIDQLNTAYSGMTLEIRMRQFLGSYKTDEQYLQEYTERGTASLDKTLRLMDSLLTRSLSCELAAPAIVSVPAVYFRGFEDGHGDKMLIRMNNAYFNSSLSEEKPQLFLVTWTYDPSMTLTAEIDRQLAEKFDGQLLRGLLGR